MSEEATPQLSYIPLTSIRVSPDFNPRKVFSDADTQEFAARLSRSGWVSPLLVRPDPENPERYLLVAGERRFRALTYMEMDQAPVTIKEMSDAEHRQLAFIENADRKDLTVAEEALTARDYVASYGGDHELAAQTLGWPLARLNHRLRLLHCTPAVMTALLDKVIQIGHAELLATLPAENQEKALPRIIANGTTVAQLREDLNGFATPLTRAIFEKTECATCPYNSECQGTLFATHIDNGRCTNKPCFQSKTEAALAEQRIKLREDFGTVAFASETVPNTTIPLIKFGDSGVGEAQFDACRGCEFRGAIINDAPGTSCGSVQSPICFNLSCHRTKVSDYLASQQSPVAGADTDDDSDDEDSTSAPGKQTAGKASASASKANGKATVKGKGKGGKAGIAAKKKAGAQSALRPVQDQYAAIIRRAALSHIEKSANYRNALAAYAMLRTVQQEVPQTGFAAICKSLGVAWGGDADNNKRHATTLIISLAAMPEAELHALMGKAATFMFDSHPNDPSFQGKINRRFLAAAIVDDAQIDTLPHTTIDAAFLDAHTRAAIENLLEESGFKDWMLASDDGKKRYAAILGLGKEKAIAQIIAAGFDFSAYQPSDFKAHLKRWTEHKSA